MDHGTPTLLSPKPLNNPEEPVLVQPEALVVDAPAHGNIDHVVPIGKADSSGFGLRA